MMYRLYNEKSGVLRNRTLGHVFIVDVECQVSSHLFGRTYIVLLHHEAISFSFSPAAVQVCVKVITLSINKAHRFKNRNDIITIEYLYMKSW